MYLYSIKYDLSVRIYTIFLLVYEIVRLINNKCRDSAIVKLIYLVCDYD